MKKILSAILALIMIMSMAAPAMAYNQDPYMSSPLVYVRGAGKGLYSDNNNPSEENEIYPVDVDIDQLMDEFLMPITEDLVSGLISDDYSEYCDTVYEAFAPIFEDVILDKNGEVTDGSGNGPQDPIPYKTTNYRIWDYDFGYDFRLSPLVIADQLKDYIDSVKKASGGKKVALLGRCLGTNVLAAYLTKYKDHALENVSNIILYVPATDGVELIGKIFSGKIKINADNVDAFVDYFLNNMDVIEDPTLKNFITATVSMLNYAKVLGVGTDAFQILVDRLQGELVPRLGLASFASFPSYWSMVPDADYEDAMKLCFEGKEEEYAGLIAKIEDYHDNVQVGFNSLLKELKASGMGVSVIAKYNISNVPLWETSNELGDLISTTEQLSYGATCANHGEVLSQSYIDSLADKKYLSPDHKIDASTCLFPDNTWFMKNVLHDEFSSDANEFLKELVESKGETTVFTSKYYPQYIEYAGYEDGPFTPVEGLDPEKPEEGSGEERFSIFIRFFTAILNFFTKLLNGELTFDGLFD